MLDVAKMIREQGIMENPVGGAYAAGWNLAQEFNNMFLGMGGTHFKPGSAEPNIVTEEGIKTLEMMKALSDYMNPDFLTHDSNATNAEFRAGNVAIMNMWGSRAATLVTAEGVPQEVIDGFAIAGPMTVGGGSTPASTLWWDGWTVAKNVSDEEAEATFLALMNAIRPEILESDEVATQAVWLIDGYEPTEAAVGVFAAAERGHHPLPDAALYGPPAHRAGQRTGRLHARQGKRRAGPGRCGSGLYRPRRRKKASSKPFADQWRAEARPTALPRPIFLGKISRG